MDMVETYEWSNFTIPYRIEKLVGALIDELEFREIVVLKYAATIGTIFDVDKLYKLNPINNFSMDDIYAILSKFEVKIKFES